MRSIQRWRWLIAAMTLVALLGVACGDDDAETDGGGTDAGAEAEVEEFPEDTTMGAIQAKGEIVVGTKFDVPLFGFNNPQTDEVEGFDPDLAQIIADRLGVELVLEEAISDNRIPFLVDGTVDLVLSTMTITTDRDAEIDFSRPYYIAHGRILTAKDSGIESADDTAGKKVCTALDSTYQTTVLPRDMPDADPKIVDSYSECFALLQRGSVDAMVTDDVILAGFLQQDDTMHIVGDDLTTDPYGAGVQDGDTEFGDFVSGVIEDIIEDGTWQELYDEWIGQYTGQEAEDPMAVTLEDALEIYPCSETC
ncbi:MAG TPA: glutamate ABC transporter substrate-binding protein [Actinomycetota bacterium]|nr:glutamate ABC transporter substrate-binding protein [Actinomycetota bacterium]